VWLGTYDAGGKRAIFEIDLGVLSDRKTMSVGSGRFISQPNSDASALLFALKKAVEASSIPEHSKRVTDLPFDFVVLGVHESKTDSGFSTQPPGDWLTLKLFFGNDDGEMYLELNPTTGEAEFEEKDDSYGDYLVSVLQKVL